MAAPEGNQFWRARAKHGREKVFESSDHLWESAQEYFQWCDDNPWLKNESVKAGDHFGETVQTPTQRPYSLGGLCIFLDVDRRTLLNYEKDENYKDFFPVISKIKEVIETQQWEGATIGAFKENIISRTLGLADKRENDIKIDSVPLFPDVSKNNSDK